MVAMAGMFVTGDEAFASFGVATMMVVAVAMLGSLTVLPALLARLGDNVYRVRVRRRGRNGGEGRMWGWIVDRVLRRPDLSAATAVGALPSTEAGVTGLTAQWKDSGDQIRSALPLVVAFVLVFAFALMLVAFRSIVVALKAIVLNSLSVAAAYGILVLVFQHGVGKGLIGFSSTAGIDPVVPLLLFVILFGLSMDYHVFLLSRIREAVARGAKTDEAVAQGIKTSAGVVTSAAVVMVAVFAVFGTLSMLIFKQF